MPLEIANMGIHRDLHIRGNLASVHRPEDQMPMVRHQAERDESDCCAIRRVCQGREEAEEIGGAGKNSFSPVTAVDDVLGDSIRKNSKWTWHSTRVLK
jgi:hypothetical protein